MERVFVLMQVEETHNEDFTNLRMTGEAKQVICESLTKQKRKEQRQQAARK
jgi:hypothetical protein